MAKKEVAESKAIKDFKAKWNMPKKPFPSEEAKALQAAEDRNYNAPVKEKTENAKPVKEKPIPVEDPERIKIVKQIEEKLKTASAHLELHNSKKESGQPAVVDVPEKKKKGK